MKGRIITALVIILAMALSLQSDASAQSVCDWFGTSTTLYTIPTSSNCKVGIGLSAPESKLHMRWTANGAPAAQLFDDAQIAENNGNVFIQLHGSSSGEKSILFAQPTNGAHGAIKYNGPEYISAQPNAIGLYTGGNILRAVFGDTSGTFPTDWIANTLSIGGSNSNSGAQLDVQNNGWSEILEIWSTSGILRLVLEDGGDLCIGCSGPTHILQVPQSSSTDPIADAWTIYSSRRWKTNIFTIDSALDTVQQLRGVRFDWIANGQNDIGLIAEEVSQVVPEVVGFDENGIADSVDYNRLVALLIEAIKEQQIQIESQQAVISTLQNGAKVVSSEDESNSNVEQTMILEQKVATLEQELAKATQEKEAIGQQFEDIEARLSAIESGIETENKVGADLTNGFWSVVGGLLLASLSFGVFVVRRKR